MDRVDGCVLGTSRRGTYIRKPHHRRDPDGGSSHDSEPQQKLDNTALWLDGIDTAGSDTSTTSDQAESRTQHRSLISAFESFIEKNERKKSKAASQQGVMLFGEHSPLTFALKETTQSRPTNLHDAATNLSKSKLSILHARDRHPPHCSKQDLDFLSAKGAFTPPEAGLEKLLVQAFLERFYPLYSMVDKEEIYHLHQKSALPFILLHAICLIGATFCDISVIHRYGFESRVQARKSFYEKAKIMFLLDYEKDKFVLLQTVIMMSFWGPHMDSSWNPCSWVGFGVTIAASLGMHKAHSASHATGKDKGLIKRIWWTLIARDAYCAALMGRPARVDMSQCDTEALSPSDFPDHNDDHHAHAMYQISVAQLSLVVRQIIAKCPMASKHTVLASDLYSLLNQWQAQLPPIVAFDSDTTGHSNVFATSLKLLYHYHVLFIHLKHPDQALQNPEYGSVFACSAASIADASAQVIASTASILVTTRTISQFPAEVFTGFLMAGIIFYRQLRQADSPTSHMARASLSNCQLLLHEVREIFDPTRWVTRIFDFLLSNTAEDASPGGTSIQQADSDTTIATAVSAADFIPNTSCFNDIVNLPDGICDLFSMDWHPAPEHDVLADYSDMWFIPEVSNNL